MSTAASRPARVDAEDRPALELLRRRRGELQAVLRRHGVPAAEAPRLVSQALLAVGSERGGAPPHGGRLLRAVEMVCGAWAAQRAAPDGAPAAGTDGGEAAFSRLLRSVARRLDARRSLLAGEQQAGPELAAELLALPEGGRGAALAEPRFRTWALVDRLLELSQEACYEDPRQALELARLAGEVAGGLDAEIYGASALCDLRARVAMAGANARRVAADLRGAEADFDAAEHLLDEGSLDPRLRADLLRLKSALCRAQSRLDDAGRLLDQALAIYRWIGDRHQQGRTLLSRVLVLELADEPRAALDLVARAVELLDPGREPRLLLVALHNLASQHVRLEEYERAAALLPRITALADQERRSLDLLRVDWLGGLVALGQGHPSGEAGLLRVRDGFLARELPFDAALVSLDLAAAYLRQGRTAETRRLADETMQLFSSYRVHREALAALLMFQQAARLENATVAMARDAYASVERARERAGVVRRPS
jgi:tetratricopeptide (TPR) repeat protein